MQVFVVHNLGNVVGPACTELAPDTSHTAVEIEAVKTFLVSSCLSNLTAATDTFTAVSRQKVEGISVRLSALGANPIEAGPDQTWWKESVVRRVLRNSDRDFVWTDDDPERSVRESIQWEFKLSSLMIRPSINPGLNDEHLDDIRSLLERVYKGHAGGR